MAEPRDAGSRRAWALVGVCLFGAPVLERLPFPSAGIPRASASVPGARFLSLCDEGSA